MENKNLTKITLMQGLNEQEISLILNCLQAKIKKYEKGETIFQEGEKIEEIGIIFSGTVTVQRNDYWGNRSIVALLGEMDVFGETFACLNQSSDVQVIAEDASEILFLQVNRVLTTCSSSCQFHNRLIRNLLEICARKNYQMNGKVDILSQKTTREKLLTLRGILLQNQVSGLGDVDSILEQQKAAELLKYGVIIVSTLPVLVIYPFLQKYFEKGVMVGSVKG